MESQKITIVIPVYDEAESIEPLMREIREIAATRALDVEVVLVDDGSRDASWSRITALAAGDPSVGGVRFRMNSGKAAALMAGFAEARGDLVVTMDADMQDPPSELPRLIQRMESGFDVVSGWKRLRHDPWHKVYPSRVFNAMIGWCTGVHLHDHVCGLKCYRREVVKQVRIYGEMHRFLAVFAAAKGFRVTEIETLHRARTRGLGKYGISRFAKGFLDLITVCMLTRFRWRPQHLIGALGLIWILLSVLSLTCFGALRFVHPLIDLGLACLTGAGLIGVGLVAEMMVAARPGDELYTITERTGWCAQSEAAPPKPV